MKKSIQILLTVFLALVLVSLSSLDVLADNRSNLEGNVSMVFHMEDNLANTNVIDSNNFLNATADSNTNTLNDLGINGDALNFSGQSGMESLGWGGGGGDFTSITFSGWFNGQPALGEGTSHTYIFSCGTHDYGFLGVYISDETSNLYIAQTNNVDSYYLDTTYDIIPGAWTHVYALWIEGSQRIWVNGVEYLGNTLTNAEIGIGNPCYIANRYSADFFMEDSLDEMYIFGDYISSDPEGEALWLYNAGAGNFLLEDNSDSTAPLANISITQSKLYNTTDINCSIDYSDNDGFGSKGNASVIWFKDNALISTYNHTITNISNGTTRYVSTLFSEVLDFGSNYTCSMQPRDNNSNVGVWTNSTTLTVQSPPAITPTAPKGNHFNTATPQFNFTFSDVDGDSGTCTLLVNGTGRGTNNSTTGATVITSSALPTDGFYTWRVFCNDTNYINYSATNNFTLDFINGTATFNNPSENLTLVIGENHVFTSDIVAKDNFLDAVNYSIHKVGGTGIVFFNSTLNIQTDTFNITDEIDFSQFGTGTYIPEVCMRDSLADSPVIRYKTKIINNNTAKLHNTFFTNNETGVTVLRTITLRDATGSKKNIADYNLTVLDTWDSSGKHVKTNITHNKLGGKNWKTYQEFQCWEGCEEIDYLNDRGRDRITDNARTFYFHADDAVLEGWETDYKNPSSNLGVISFKSPDQAYYDALSSRYTIDPITGGLNKICINGSSIKVINYTAIEHFDFDIPDTVFDSTSYIVVVNESFNQTLPRKLNLRGSGNIKKQTGGSESTFSMRITLNGNVLMDESLGSVQGLGRLNLYSIPFLNVTTQTGSNTLIIEVKESGLGSINISSFNIHALSDRTSSETNATIVVLEETEFIFTSTSFINVFNHTFNKSINSTTLFDTNHKVSASGATLVSCYWEESGVLSSVYSRSLGSASDIGSTGNVIVGSMNRSGEINIKLFCKDDSGETISNNISVLRLDGKDNQGNIINMFGVGNASTNLTSNITLSAGTWELVRFNNFNVRSGNELELGYAISFRSVSGAQTPRFFTRIYNGSTIVNKTPIARFLVDNSDVGTVKHYDSYGVRNLTYNSSLFVIVPSGESLMILDESLTGNEMFELDTITGQAAPLPNSIISPENNTWWGDGNNTGNVTWAKFMDINNDVVTYNISIINRTTGAYIDFVGNTTNLYTPIVYSNYSDGNYSIMVMGCDDGLLCSNSTVNMIKIDNTKPIITINSPTNSTFKLRQININFSATDTGIGMNQTFYNNGSANITFDSQGNISIAEGAYSFVFHANDILGNIGQATADFTVSVDPIIALTSPANDSQVSNDTEVSFKYFVNDTNVNNCTLYLNDSDSGWSVNTTNLTITNNATNTIGVVLPIGAYLWNVQCADALNNFNFSVHNFTTKVKANTAPIISANTTNPLFPRINDVTTIKVNISDPDGDAFTTQLNVTRPNGTSTNQTLTLSGGNYSTTVTFNLYGQWNLTPIVIDNQSSRTTSSMTVLIPIIYAVNTSPSSPGIFDNLPAWANSSIRLDQINFSITNVNGTQVMSSTNTTPQHHWLFNSSTANSIRNGTYWINISAVNRQANFSYTNNWLINITDRRDHTPQDIVVAPSPRTEIIQQNITIWHDGNVNQTYDIAGTIYESNCSLSFDKSSIGIPFDNANLLSPAVIGMTINCSAGVVDGVYFGEYNLTRSSDNKVFNTLIRIGINPPAARIELFNTSSATCGSAGGGICSFRDSIFDDETISTIYRVNNTGSFNATGCNLFIDGIDFEGTSFASFNTTDFTIPSNVSQDVKLTITNPTVGIYQGHVIANCSSSTSLGFPTRTLSNNEPYVFLQSLVATITPSTPPPAGQAGGAPPTAECVEDEDCIKFGLDFFCISSKCVKQDRSDIAFSNLLELGVSEDLAKLLSKDGICNWDGMCEISEGENKFNCGIEREIIGSSTIVIEGDCTSFDIDLQPEFLGIVFVIFIVIIFVLNQKKFKFRRRKT